MATCCGTDSRDYPRPLFLIVIYSPPLGANYNISPTPWRKSGLSFTKGHPMIKPEKPPKKDRKQRIKDQNAKRKPINPLRDPKMPEELERQMQGFTMIALGFLKVMGIDPARLIEKADEFPSEIDLE
jgi:hypothetical protein